MRWRLVGDKRCFWRRPVARMLRSTPRMETRP